MSLKQTSKPSSASRMAMALPLCVYEFCRALPSECSPYMPRLDPVTIAVRCLVF